MADQPKDNVPRGRWNDLEQVADNAFAEAALERHKAEGMRLAVRARFIAMGVIALMLPILDFAWHQLWYEALVVGFVLIGWAQLRVARVGRSRAEVLLIFADLALMTVVVTVPNPLHSEPLPLPMELRAEGFKWFFVILALGTLAYSSRTVRGIGSMVSWFWVAAIALMWWRYEPDPALTEAAQAAFGSGSRVAEWLDPNAFLYWLRVQDVVAIVIVAWILSVSSRRSSELLMRQARLERERANLSRYFSPNVVEELSQNDEPLKSVRTQEVAVMFVDIVGFTAFSADRPPQEVIETLREFHKRMEREVFAHGGTLDKYLGDGLMATFGTPMAGEADALNALRCARAMIASMQAWNAERAAAGEPPIQVGVGLHYGPAVLGDLGSERLEFAVIGDTVNVASRVEALTRPLGASLAATDALVETARREANGSAEAALSGLDRREGQEIRGLDERIAVWTCAA